MQFSETMLADPGVFALGRLPAHSSHRFCFGSGESCELPLDGMWDFRWAPRPDGDFTPWTQIRVPGHIQLQGGPGYPFGTPQYVNKQYPWDGHEAIRPGQIPQRWNPTGEYRRIFVLPETWQRCRIRFEGADSALALWCNGVFAGYSESSFDTAEFDLTELVHPGENELVARVYRFCSGSWLEDQDFWRMSGLFRPVTLFTTPDAHLVDIRVQTALNADGSAAVQADCRLENAGAAAALRLTLDGHSWQLPAGETVCVKAGIDHPRLWSAEAPNLYPLCVELLDTDGNVIERSSLDIGVREFGIRDGVMTLNGKRIVFKGVDRHEWSAEHGRAVTYEETEWDIINLKRHNVNAIRTSHYPNRNFLYDLCDRYGLYIIDETNLETHGSWEKRNIILTDANTLPDGNPAWRDAVLARAEAMYERDKNHACVLIWSCGNESYGGETLKAMHDYLRQADPGRVVHYEGVAHDRRYNDTSDIESQMYPPAAQVREFLAEHRDKPMILCEYGHSMGNSCGALEEYTELAWQDPLYQGGFLWEYMDHSLWRQLPDGRRVLVYGGDFGERPHDGEFCADGLVTGDRRNSAKMQAVRGVYQDFVIQVDADGIRLCNRCLFTDLDRYDLRVTLNCDGELRRSATLRQALAPGESCTLALPFPLPQDDGLWTVDVTVCLREATSWADAGFVVAQGQGIFDRRPAADSVPADDALFADCDFNYGVTNGDYGFIINRNSGRLVSLRRRGVELLDGPAELNFWRAPTCNDDGAAMPFHFAKWAQAGRYAQADAVERVRGGVRVHYRLATAEQEGVEALWKFDNQGRCTVTLTWEGGDAEVPEFGLLLPLTARLDRVSILGLGPKETMPDRERGAMFGRWEYPVGKDEDIYMVPQENGAHTGVTQATLSGDGVPSLHLSTTGEMILSAGHWTPNELENARHFWQLPPVTRTIVRCAAGMRGAGGDDSWGALPLEPYRYTLHRGDSFTFTFWTE